MKYQRVGMKTLCFLKSQVGLKTTLFSKSLESNSTVDLAINHASSPLDQLSVCSAPLTNQKHSHFPPLASCHSNGEGAKDRDLERMQGGCAFPHN